MKAEHYRETRIELEGWPVNLASYKLGDKWVCTADNVSPGACLARITAESREDAEAQAISKSRHMLGKTKIHQM